MSVGLETLTPVRSRPHLNTFVGHRPASCHCFNGLPSRRDLKGPQESQRIPKVAPQGSSSRLPNGPQGSSRLIKVPRGSSMVLMAPIGSPMVLMAPLGSSRFPDAPQWSLRLL
uniref:Uncharacterized protein n=1 Tax=Timema genevievae TaxID=629358 RepID=A0A7R9JRL9_TIMGE|nr:unnamed protein product [Timema genevievae]